MPIPRVGDAAPVVSVQPKHYLYITSNTTRPRTPASALPTRSYRPGFGISISLPKPLYKSNQIKLQTIPFNATQTVANAVCSR